MIIGGGPAGLTAAVYLARYHPPDARPGFQRAETIPAFPPAFRARNFSICSGSRPVGSGRGHSLPRCFVKADRKRASAQVCRRSDASLQSAARDGHRRRWTIWIRRFRPDRSDIVPFAMDTRRPIVASPFWDRAPTLLRRRNSSAAFRGRLPCFSKRHSLQKAEAADLAASGIEILQPIGALRKSPDGIRVEINGKGSVDFEIVYPALGCDARSQLASDLGAETTEVGCLKVDRAPANDRPRIIRRGRRRLRSAPDYCGHGSCRGCRNAHAQNTAAEPALIALARGFLLGFFTLLGFLLRGHYLLSCLLGLLRYRFGRPVHPGCNSAIGRSLSHWVPFPLTFRFFG